MKAQPMKKTPTGLKMCGVEEATHVALNFPGPSGLIFLPVLPQGRTRRGTGAWSWNQDTEKPTMKPSVRTRGGDFLCHSLVEDGKVKFLGDSSHDLKWKTVPLLDTEDILEFLD